MKFIRFLYTQNKKQLAVKLGCTEAMIHIWIRRGSFPRPHMAEKIISLSKGKLTYRDIYEISQEEEIVIEKLRLSKEKLKEVKKEIKEIFEGKNPKEK